MKDCIRIGGAAGFWGDSITGPLQLARADIDFMVFDYLAELTMSLLAGARQKDPKAGYATDFIDAMRAVLKPTRDKGIRIISNAGGVNPRACAEALAALAAELDVAVKIAVVEGDDVMPQLAALREAQVREWQSGAPLPAKLLSANAYLGALPIKAALDAGADIVITGRCVDSAVTLGALWHAFDWPLDDYDRLAQASLAGHLIECGCQGAGGLFTDWQSVPDWPNAGYPIVECRRDGGFVITKPAGSGGLVTAATVAEQLLYEIGDPARYVLPDVVCDFTEVRLNEAGADRVEVLGAHGLPPPTEYKVSATYLDGWRCQAQLTVIGVDAERKAQRTAEAILRRCRALLERHGWGDFSATHTELLGRAESFGPHVERGPCFETVLWLAVRHANRAALELFAREIAPAATSWAPGTTGAFGRPSVAPAIKPFFFLIDKARLQPVVRIGDDTIAVSVPAGAPSPAPATPPVQAEAPLPDQEMRDVRLIELAHARSGDKGDSVNIGVIARRREYLPWLRAQLTERSVADYLGHLVQGPVTRYELPGIGAFNFVGERALGGGGAASLRHDPWGKGLAQVLLAMPVRVPRTLP